MTCTSFVLTWPLVAPELPELLLPREPAAPPDLVVETLGKTDREPPETAPVPLPGVGNAVVTAANVITR